MAGCTSPLLMDRKAKGHGGMVWRGLPAMSVRCGRCLGCRMASAQSWATRIVHESELHERNSFVTLTYSPEHLPDPPTLSRRVHQLFLKRLRKALGRPIRFFMCGEYGGKTARPHYHYILFGEDFVEDRTPWRKTPAGFLLYRSELLERAWPFGHAEVGQVTQQSAGYVARYALKKAQSPSVWKRVNAQTGEVYQVEPEFQLMSRMPGLGAGWLDRFQSDVLPRDYSVVNGSKVPVPAYYVRRWRALGDLKGPSPFNLEFLRLSTKRAASMRARAPDNTSARRRVKDELNHLRAKQLLRSLDDDA